MITIVSTIGTLLFFSISTNAAEVSPPLQKSVELTGILDGYYLSNFNRPKVPTSQAPNNQLRYFDFFHNQFTVSLAEIGIRAKMEDLSILIDLDYGHTADFTHGAPASVDEVSKHIGQAFLTYRPVQMPRFQLLAGKFSTHIGLETTKAKDNWQYSRSVTYAYGMPFWHMGIGLGYDLIPEELIFTVYAVNGWNNLMDNNSGKSFGAQLKWIASPEFSLVYNMMAGPEQSRNNSKFRHLHELNALYQWNSNFALSVEALTGFEEVGSDYAAWQGFTVATKWQALSWYSLSPRLEFYRDADGFTIGGGYAAIGPKENYYGATLTNSFSLSKYLDFRLEGRFDRSSLQSRFITNDGNSKNQLSILGALIASF